MKVAIFCLALVCLALTGRVLYIETKLKELSKIVLDFMQIIVKSWENEENNE